MPPRPRPRPHPCTASTSSLPVTLDQPGTLNHDARSKRSKNDDDDEDALFMRNKGRSLRDVHKRAARGAVVTQASSSLMASEDEDEDEEDTPKQGLGKNRKQNIFDTGKAKTLPKWAKKGAILNMLGNSDSDSESENNDPYSYVRMTSKRRRTDRSNSGTPSRRGKRARTRSRTRSLTPPPGLSNAQKLRAQMAIEHVLSSEQDGIPPPVPELEAEDDVDGFDVGDTSVLDPELQHIALAISERASKQNADDNYRHTQQSCLKTTHHNLGSGPPLVTVRVKWISHPENDVMRGRAQQSWSFIMKRHDSFKDLFFQASEKAHVLVDDLVLMRDGKQVFTSITPEGLGLWDKVEMEACDRATFEALRSRHFRSPTPMQQDPDEHETAPGGIAPHSGASEEPDDTGKFKLVLRASGTKEFTLTARSTTTCGNIVRAFLAVVAKHGGKVPASPRKVSKVRLCIDGEKQDPDTPISHCELEDGDMIEVVGM